MTTISDSGSAMVARINDARDGQERRRQHAGEIDAGMHGARKRIGPDDAAHRHRHEHVVERIAVRPDEPGEYAPADADDRLIDGKTRQPASEIGRIAR